MSPKDTPHQPRSRLWRALRIGGLSLLALAVVVGAAYIYMFGPFGPKATVPAVAPLTATPAAALPAPAPLALVNGLLIDGSGADPLPDAVVLIRDGHIAAAGPRSAVSIPPDAQVINVRGAAILPGLINAHVHYAYDVERLKRWAQAGVTTVREMGILAPGETLEQRYMLRDNSRIDPHLARIVAASPFFTAAPNGYPDGYGFHPVASPEDARIGAMQAIDQGAELIKLAFEDHTPPSSPYWPVLPLAEAQALVKVAHERGVRASVHITQAKYMPLALDAGVDEIAHIPYEPLSDEDLQRAVQAKILWTPTLEMYAVSGETVFGRVPGIDTKHALSQTPIDNLRRIVAAGGIVALGNDYGGAAGTFQEGLPMLELELMQEAGMSPMQILVAATQTAARACGKLDQLGTIAPGKIADVLVVNGSPLDDLHHLQDVRLVIKGGMIIRQDAE